ncbi:MAG: serine protease [Melioribacteraceae bacterium]
MKSLNIIGYFLLVFLATTFAQTQRPFLDTNTKIDIEVSISSGTGFLISENGYVVTSYHIINNAKNISVEITNLGLVKTYPINIIEKDSINDLAILKINSSTFRTKDIPFNIIDNDVELGASVFTLGYPMIETMGKTIKLSNGIISSENGFMGNENAYQISVPINPGNSGGPLFDETGSLVGVIKSIYSGAENVAYAIKSKHVNKLCSKYITAKEMNMSNTKKVFVDHVRTLKDLVCLIKAEK